MGVDKRLLRPEPGPPKWLGLQGFSLFDGGRTVSATPGDLAPEGFAVFSRFCRRQSVVPLGYNVDHDGEALDGKDGAAAMYFVVAVEATREESEREVDVGPVVNHRRVTRVVSRLGRALGGWVGGVGERGVPCPGMLCRGADRLLLASSLGLESVGSSRRGDRVGSSCALPGSRFHAR